MGFKLLFEFWNNTVFKTGRRLVVTSCKGILIIYSLLFKFVSDLAHFFMRSFFFLPLGRHSVGLLLQQGKFGLQF